MAKVKVSPGVCGFETEVEASVDPLTFESVIEISSQCKHVQALADEINGVDAMEAVTRRMLDNPLYAAASRAKLHAACPVPCAVIKALETAAGLALPAAVHIEIEKNP